MDALELSHEEKEAALAEGPEIVIVNPDGTVDGESDEDAPKEEHKGRGKVAPPPKRRDWPQDLLDRAASIIDREFIDGGGDYREDQRGTIYWLDLDHLVAFEEADQQFKVDQEFWDWFKGYRKEHQIEPRKGSRKWTTTFGDYEYTSHDHNYMTSWWDGWGYKASSETTQKLAIAVGAVSSIVSVINDTGKPFKTRLATEDDRDRPQSVTYFDQQEVVVSPQALLDTSISEDMGIEVTAGWGLHEGSHVRFTSQILDVLSDPSLLTPLVTAQHLFNLLEDVRIESKTSDQFPGFEGYFDKANAYLWDVTKHLAPTQWGPELGDKMNVITASVKWSTEYGQIVATSNDQRLKDEYVWFSNWAETYRVEKKDARRSLIEALAHLEEDQQTAQQMKDQAEKERQRSMEQYGEGPETLTNDEFKDLLRDLKQMLKDGKGKSLFEPCPSPDKQSKTPEKKIALTREQAAEIDKLIQEELQQATSTIGPSAGRDKITVFKPIEDQNTKARYVKPSPIVGKLKSAFVFRKTIPEWSDRAQRSGQLDENDLWKIVGNDLRVFERKITADTPNTQVTMLVDMSSSMRGTNVRKAQDLANTMLECLKTMKGVTVRVRGHNHVAGSSATLYRIWEQGDPQTRLGVIGELCAGSTPDGLALDWCAQELMANHKPGEDMVIIILSDGQPNVAPSGLTGPEHVHQVVEHFRQRGVTIVSIGLGHDVYGQETMYRHYIKYETDQRLPMQLTKLLIKLFGGATS